MPESIIFAYLRFIIAYILLAVLVAIIIAAVKNWALRRRAYNLRQRGRGKHRQ